jgi:transcriptional regulator with XRE-family HTH domain
MRSEPERLGTQPKVSKVAGISQSSVSRILKAKQGITLEMLSALEKVTGVSAYKLLLSPPDAPTPPDRDHSEGQQLMRRLQGAPKEAAPESKHEGTKPGAPGVHHHRPKPARRKKSSSSR